MSVRGSPWLPRTLLTICVLRQEHSVPLPYSLLPTLKFGFENVGIPTPYSFNICNSVLINYLQL